MLKKSFTLVEIMIVIAVVALLAALAIPNLLRAKINANEGSAQTILKHISNAIESYATANVGKYPTAITDLTTATPPYLNEDLATLSRGGYTFSCETLTESAYSCTATPTTCGKTGTKTYTISTGGILASAACT